LLEHRELVSRPQTALSLQQVPTSSGYDTKARSELLPVSGYSPNTIRHNTYSLQA
jgi:hypothetical protein